MLNFYYNLYDVKLSWIFEMF